MRRSSIFLKHPHSAFLLVALLSSCTPASKDTQRQGGNPDAQSLPAASTNADMTGADLPVPPVPDTDAATINAAKSHSAMEEPDVPNSAKAAVYIGRSKNLVAVPSIAMPAQLTVSNGCLIIVSDGSARATAVFPPGAKAEYSGNALIAIASEGKRYPLNKSVTISGGGIDRGDVQLVEPVPQNCPDTLYGIGG